MDNNTTEQTNDQLENIKDINKPKLPRVYLNTEGCIKDFDENISVVIQD